MCFLGEGPAQQAAAYYALVGAKTYGTGVEQSSFRPFKKSTWSLRIVPLFRLEYMWNGVSFNSRRSRCRVIIGKSLGYYAV